jgi:hypothetical protein
MRQQNLKYSIPVPEDYLTKRKEGRKEGRKEER